MPTLQDVQNKYGGNWRNIDLGGGDWYRAARLDPIAQLVWSPQYGWQDAGQVKRMLKRGGSLSDLTPQMDLDYLNYYMAKPEGTSDPELRAQYGKDWMDYFAGSDFFKQYAQHQAQNYDRSHPYWSMYGPNSGWNWGNEAAGSKFGDIAGQWSWYNYPGAGGTSPATQPIEGPGGTAPGNNALPGAPGYKIPGRPGVPEKDLGMAYQMAGLQPSRYNYGGGYGMYGKQPRRYF